MVVLVMIGREMNDTGAADLIEWIGITIRRHVGQGGHRSRTDADLAGLRLVVMTDGLMNGAAVVNVITTLLTVDQAARHWEVIANIQVLHRAAMIAASGEVDSRDLGEVIVRHSLPIAVQADIVRKDHHVFPVLPNSTGIVDIPAHHRMLLSMDLVRSTAGQIIRGVLRGDRLHKCLIVGLEGVRRLLIAPAMGSLIVAHQ